MDAPFGSEALFGGSHVPLVTVAVRLLVAAVLGAAIGFNRERRDKPAGLKTHMLVALGAALFAVLALELFGDALDADDDARPDPLRIIEAMAKAIAFLGAGAIIQARGTVAGITTGASIWLAGAIGMTVGTGHLVIAVIATLFVLAILIGVHAWEERVLRGPDSKGDHSEP